MVAQYRSRPLEIKFDWLGDSITAVLGRKIFAVREEKLWVFDLNHGRLEQLGKDRWQTKLLIAVGDHLCAIENDGGMYWVDPSDGSWREMDGDWRMTKAVASLGGGIYISDGGGLFYQVNPGEGGWHEIPCGASWNTQILMSTVAHLCAIEATGSAVLLHPASGRTQQLEGDWSGALHGAGLEGRFYVVRASGEMMVLDENEGVWEPCCPELNWLSLRALFPVGSALLAVQRDGSATLLEPQHA